MSATTLAVEMAYWQQTILRSVGVLVAVLLPAGTLVYVFLFKMMSFMQSRLGPMEAGPYGSMQLLAEVGKWIQKEDLIPERADRKLFAYALGRSLTHADGPAVEEIRKRLVAAEYRFGALVESIVATPQFLEKRGRDDPREVE